MPLFYEKIYENISHPQNAKSPCNTRVLIWKNYLYKVSRNKLLKGTCINLPFFTFNSKIKTKKRWQESVWMCSFATVFLMLNQFFHKCRDRIKLLFIQLFHIGDDLIELRRIWRFYVEKIARCNAQIIAHEEEPFKRGLGFPTFNVIDVSRILPHG